MSIRFSHAAVLLTVLFVAGAQIGFGQTAQILGRIYDPTDAVVQGAEITVSNVDTGVERRSASNEQGYYVVPLLPPGNYRILVQKSGFRPISQSGIRLVVNQEARLDFRLQLGAVTETVLVEAPAPLLNAVSAALGQEVTNRYITEVPLLGRNVLNLVFLAPGVTEVRRARGGAGTNFVSNGQRNATAEVRLDGGLLTLPESGEGGTSEVSYRPSVEIVQEFKIQNNSFGAQYGHNGGTAIEIVSKSGSNELHGSGYWFGRRPQLDANTFFANRAGLPKSDYKRDQFGGSIGGPIRKQKSFFFFDFEKLRFDSPDTITATVPTALEKRGDFSRTFNQDGSLQAIFNPFDTYKDAAGNVKRRPFPGNLVPAAITDPVGLRIVKLYPDPSGAGDPITGRNNFTRNIVNSEPAHQYDIKLDQNFSEKSRLSGRYSRYHSGEARPSIFADGSVWSSDAHNAVVEHTWTRSPSTLWTNRTAVHRSLGKTVSEEADPVSLGFPPILRAVSGLPRLPGISIEGYRELAPGCCIDTVAGQTQYQYSSQLFKVIGAHNLILGGEQRIFFNNFFQPDFPTGYFMFDRPTTAQDVFAPNRSQGNGLASLLVGFGSGGYLGMQPGPANKSKETSFYVQDDWKVGQRLTVNLGVRYEWSTPFTERFNRLQISNFDADSGVDIPGLGRIRGVVEFTDSKRRSIRADRSNLAPRLGLAYSLNKRIVLRAGAGVYYGYSYATNYQQVGSAFRAYNDVRFSLDGGITRHATLQNPFPDGVTYGQGRKYGTLALWGYSVTGNLSDTLRSPEIYQWNAGIQGELPGSILLEVVYSANRSTHLPFGGSGSKNRNFVGRADREKYGTRGLRELVPNPFLPLFQGPNARIHEPDSLYNKPTIQRVYLLRPYPQFAGAFWGIHRFDANATYNALQVRFEKRTGHGLNLLASYTYSKLYDSSSVGSNSWMGNTAAIQDLTNRRAEWSVGASDTPHRVVAGGSYELPFGRGKYFGNQINSVLNGIAGGWQVNFLLTLQSGTPLNLAMSAPRLVDGRQRPNISGNARGADIKTVVNRQGNYFNWSAFSDPGDQIPGNAPRFCTDLRGDGINSIDLSFFKNFRVREKMNLQLRAEFFNFTNTPRFSDPASSFGSVAFGTISSQYNSPRRAQMGVRFLF